MAISSFSDANTPFHEGRNEPFLSYDGKATSDFKFFFIFLGNLVHSLPKAMVCSLLKYEQK